MRYNRGMQSGSSDGRQIAKAAGTVMFAFILSSVIGLVRQILVARAFGTAAEIEAFNAANRVAETLFNLVAGGALSSAFIPTFTGLLTQGRKPEAWKLASSVANLILLVLTVLCALAALFAPQIVRHILAPGFQSAPEKEQMTIGLLRVMLPSAAIFGLSGLAMAILNSYKVFFIPAITPSLYQVGLIFGVLVLKPYFGIWGLAYGVLIGASLHLGVQLPYLMRLGWSYVWMLGLNVPEVREVGRLMAPRLLGVAVVQLNFWINTRLASSMPEGSVTAIVLAFTLMLMPEAAIAQSFAIAALPTFSEQVATGHLERMRASLVTSLRGVLLLSLPASLGLMLMRIPIVQMLYQRGEFSEWSTTLVSWALLWYAAGLVGHAFVEVLSRSFYAFHDTRTPVLVGTMAMSMNVGFSFLFSFLFHRIGWLPHGGLALANSLATGIEALILLWLMARRLKPLDFRRIGIGFLQAGLASAGMIAFLLVWLTWSQAFPVGVIVLGGVLGSAAVYAAVGFLVRIEEVEALRRLAWEKIKLRGKEVL